MHFTFIIVLIFCTIQACVARVVEVNIAGSVKTIKEGIDRAQSGDTVLIKSGIYREGNIFLKKSLVLIGEMFPVLDGENKYEILTIHANKVVVKGLKFINTGIASINDLAAIKVLESNNVRIIGNKINKAFFGIYLTGASNCWIENNQLQAEATSEHEIGNGIHLWKCERITIHNNVVKGHRDGIYFEFVTNSLITDNRSEANLRYGLHFMFSHNDEYKNNSFVRNGAGVAVMYTKNVKMEGNTFEQNWGASSYGLLLKDIRDSFVENNRFINNSIGIYMEGSSRIQFKANTFSGNGWALKLMASCDDNVFERNDFVRNTFDVSTNGTLVLNTFKQNHWDKYEGYDLDKDGTGDVYYRPVSMFSMVVERVPTAMMLWRSFLVFLMDRSEKVMPAIIPENLKDDSPVMKAYDYSR